MQYIREDSEEFKTLNKQWYKEAKSIKTPEEFTLFYNHLTNDYGHDYGTMVHAIGAISVAAASMGANKMGISGFQASCVMWDFIMNWCHSGNKCGMKLIDYDLMLYPQYEHKFDKYIDKHTFTKLQEEVMARLMNNKYHAHPDVVNHWKSILNDKVPFGYKIMED